MMLDEAMKEEHHKATITATFDTYLQNALSANQRRRADFFSMPIEERQLLQAENDDYKDLLSRVDDCLTKNDELVRAMIAEPPFPASEDAAFGAPAPTESDHEVRLLYMTC